MRRKKYLVIPCLILIGFMANGEGFRSQTYVAYIGNQMDSWKKTIQEMERLKSAEPDILPDLVNFQYGYIGWAIGINLKKEAAGILKEAESNLSELEKSGYSPSWINAYKSAFYGFKISLNPIKAPFLGPKSMEHANTAVKKDPDNYFAYVQLGNIYFYMPAAFGGSKKTALEYLLKAEKLIEKDPVRLKENWNYLSLLVFIGQVRIEIKEYEAARTTIEKIMKIEPRFSWVRDELYPQLLNKIKNNK
jgi:hypothetical protein